MGDVHEGDADLVVDGVELDEHVLAQLEVERGERLVEEQHLRAVDEGARDGDALLLPAGELVGVLPGVLAHLDHLQYRVDLLLDLGLGALREPERERDVVPDRHRREQRVVLEDGVHAALVRGEVRYVLALQVDAPGVGALEAAEHAKERSLPAPAGAQQGEELAFPHGKRDVVDGSQRAEPFRDVVEHEKVVFQFLAPSCFIY